MAMGLACVHSAGACSAHGVRRCSVRTRAGVRWCAGFTLIEVIVTIVVLSVVFGVITPRLLALGGATGEAEAERVIAAVGAVARRSSLGSERMALLYTQDASGSAARIRVLSYRTGRGEGDEGEPSWRKDPFVEDIELESLGVWRAAIGGVEYARGGGEAGFRFEVEPGQVRAGLTIELRERPMTDSGSGWVIELPSYGTRVDVVDPNGRSTGDRLGAFDLDAAGDGEGRW